MAAPQLSSRRRVGLRVDGVVQGVGFRPYVYRLARELELGGTVCNDSRGVLIEIEGGPAQVERFLARLPAEAPPLASIDAVRASELEPSGEVDFAVASSLGGGEPDAFVSADAATCAECLAEMLDPADRRHRYPFVNCTNCGPRFTIVRDVPYDRPATTMADFAMCALCRAEYEDPADRRFHAQPNACPACGPELRLLGGADGAVLAGGEGALVRSVEAIGEGAIVAVKGLGGYHLACRAGDEGAVARLRARKHREDRPFALMVAGTEEARELVELTAAGESLLGGRERPIVIARRREQAPVAASVAPAGPDLGVMAAYSPLHHLLAREVGAPLVMTSANVSDEPIAYDDADALARLGSIAELILAHDRPIHVRTDDSVVRAVDPGLRRDPLVIRRSRGYVPGALPLPDPARRPILACGAELKSTFCLARGDRAWVSHHIGDLKNFETLTSFREGVVHFKRLFAVEPALVAHDLHPDYLSTTYALGLPGVARLAVQHHHAHLAAVLAEHGERGTAIGAIFDGTGFGPDNTVWGGELLVGGLGGYERGGLLFPVRLPGGDAAVREPWRMACAWLSAALEQERPQLPRAFEDRVEEARWNAVCDLIRTGVSSPLTTSAGRLFDAVAALCGLRTEVSHEGQAAGELEGIAAPPSSMRDSGAYPLAVIDEGDAPLLLDARETIRAVAGDLEQGAGADTVSARFHAALARATAAACVRLAERHGTDIAVLGGGVFQNRLLLESTAARLAEAGLRVLLPLRLPPNDGAISYGQAAIAAHIDEKESE